MMPVLLVLIGLVFDGGLMWNQQRRARWAADGAAVAAASEIDAIAYASTGQVKLTGDAINTASRYAQLNYPGMYISRVFVHDEYVYVDGRVEIELYFLGMMGIENPVIRVVGRERPGWGISEEGQ